MRYLFIGLLFLAGNLYAVDTSKGVGTLLTKSSATATYLQKSSATATYLNKSSAAVTYIEKSSASATYLQLSSATAIYLQIEGGTMTGHFGISKVDPEIRIADTGDSNSARWTRTDTDGKMTVYNICEKGGGTGNALEFDRTASEYVAIDNSSVLGSGDWTVALWYKSDDDNTNERNIFSETNNTSDTQYQGVIIQDNLGSLRFANRNGGDSSFFDSVGTSYDDGAWHSVVFVKDATNDFTAYIDGDAETLTDTTNIPAPTITRTTIGAYRRTSISRYMDGTIDEVRLFNAAKSAAWALAFHNSGAGTYGLASEANLVAGWHLDEASGTTADNYEGTATYDGTLTNMAGDEWTAGLIVIPGSDVEVTVLSSEDSATKNEEGIQTFGDSAGRTVINGSLVGVADSTPEVELDVAGQIAIDVDLVLTSTPRKAGILAATTSWVLYISSGATESAWIKVGGQ